MNLLEKTKAKLLLSKITKASNYTIPWITLALAFSTPVFSAGLGHQSTAVERGQEVAFTRKLGNCLACHLIPGGVSAGNIAPPLMGMKARFPNKEKLRAQIWDPRVINPDTSMLPFGAHAILTESQINDLVEYLYTI